MFTRKVGPIWSVGEEGAGGAGAGGADTGDKTGTQNADDGSVVTDPVGDKAGTAFAALDEDTRTWLQTKGLTGVDALAKSARESEKLLGNAVRIPGKDATPEEREAFLTKLGRPETPEGYEFAVPKDMPEGMPYDGKRANKLKQILHKAGVPKGEAQAIHDAYIADELERYSSMGEAKAAAMQQRGEAETAKIVKLWGPLDGDTARANLEIADKTLNMTPGGAEYKASMQEAGLIGPEGEVLDAATAQFLASLGTALYTEDGVLRGKPDFVGNPFDKKAASFNLTEAMAIAKADPDRALSYITAAGLKPEEFGLKST